MSHAKLSAVFWASVLACSFLEVAGGRLDPRSPTTVRADEQYLQPYINDLADYGQSPTGKFIITIANIVDIVPTWLEDLLLPLFLKGSKVAMPVNKVFPLPDLDIKIGNATHQLKTLTVHSVTIENLNEIANLDLKFLSGGQFTWGGNVAFKDLAISGEASIEMDGATIDLDLKMTLVNPSIDMSVILALDRSKLCDVWGTAMQSSFSCAAWPILMRDGAVSGLNVTRLAMNLSDFDLSLKVVGDDELAKLADTLLTDAMKKLRPSIIAAVPAMSANIAKVVNQAFVMAQPSLKCPAAPTVSTSTLDVSRVCVSNNGAFVLKWLYHDCPAKLASAEPSGFPVDQSLCMDVTEALPSVAEGDILRVQSHAVWGMRHLMEPGARYKANSNTASYECTGTTLDYHCDLVSFVPVDPAVMPAVATVCVINHAGFVMNFDMNNSRTGALASTTNYPINQKQCVELSGQEGDVFTTEVHAILGRSLPADRQVQYKANGLTATYECRGTTLDYSCKLMA